MEAYGLSYRNTLKLPLKTFWSLNRQVNRLRAEKDQRQLRLAGAQSKEAAQAIVEMLNREIGTPVILQKSFDEGAFVEWQEKFDQGAS